MLEYQHTSRPMVAILKITTILKVHKDLYLCSAILEEMSLVVNSLKGQISFSAVPAGTRLKNLVDSKYVKYMQILQTVLGWIQRWILIESNVGIWLNPMVEIWVKYV